MRLRRGWTAENKLSRALNHTVNVGYWMGGTRRDLQLDIFRLVYNPQAKAPLRQFPFMCLLRALFEVVHKVFVGCADQGLG